MMLLIIIIVLVFDCKAAWMFICFDSQNEGEKLRDIGQ